MSGESTKRVVDIDVISDTHCPWCYVGKRNLEEACRQIDRSKVEFKVTWHPFQLAPNLPHDPKQSEKRKSHYEKKFGAGMLQRMMPRMEAVGKACTPPITWSYDGLMGNSFLSHRLIKWSNKFGSEKQNAVVEILFEQMFEKNGNITDPEVLVKAAKDAGLPEDEARTFINGTELSNEVQRECNENRDVGGVPNFTVDQRAKLSGGQPVEQWLALFKRMGLPLAD